MVKSFFSRRSLLIASGASVLMLLPLHHSLLHADNEAPAPAKEPLFVDLQTQANRNLGDNQHGFSGNNFSELKTGAHEFAGVRFQIGEKYLALGSKVEHSPTKIEGLKVDASAGRIHFLHGTGYGAYGDVGDALFTAEDTLIGQYVIHYADNTTATVPIEYGKDVRDWWCWDKPFQVSRGKVAWTGQNLFARQQNQQIHLYLATWENPKPDVKILSIDYTSTATTAAAPFCMAITVEGK
jgi:hypothetical protein